jgi:ankyrin repeat protein
MQALIQSAPNLDKQTLFQTAICFNRCSDVEYLLKNFSNDIDVSENAYFCFKHICHTRNVNMLKIVLSLGKSAKKIAVNELLRIAPFIPLVMKTYSIKLDKKLAEILSDIAINGNHKETFQFLIEMDIQDFISDYKYVIVASGAGRNDILSQFSKETVKDVSDECIETAFFCQNKQTLEMLISNYTISNIFLEQKVKEYLYRR